MRRVNAESLATGRCRLVYWWTKQLTELRKSCNRVRRAYTRCRRRNGFDPILEHHLRCAYKEHKKALQLAIRLAKDQGRQELLASLNRDPSGCFYLAARNKLHVQFAPLVETLSTDFVLRLVTELLVVVRDRDLSVQEEELMVPSLTEVEMDMALRRLRAKKTAPGPDGIPGRVLSIALEYLGGELRELFDQCLVTGQFPKI